MPLLLNDAQTVGLQMRIVSENLLTKTTRKQHSTIHGKLFELWGRYEDGEISTSKQVAEGFIFLNLFDLLECLVMWLISMPVIKV